MNIIATNEEMAGKQREIINEMRRDGSLLSSINETLVNNEGVAARSAIIDGVIMMSGLTADEAKATHQASSGVSRNTLQDIVGFLSADMKAGVYGDQAAMLQTDGSGIWMLDGVINVDKAIRIFDKNSAKTKEDKEKLQSKYKKELAQAFKELSSSAKATFKNAGGNMKQCVSNMMDNGVTALESIQDK